jgi:hypothetical protein
MVWPTGWQRRPLRTVFGLLSVMEEERKGSGSDGHTIERVVVVVSTILRRSRYGSVVYATVYGWMTVAVANSSFVSRWAERILIIIIVIIAIIIVVITVIIIVTVVVSCKVVHPPQEVRVDIVIVSFSVETQLLSFGLRIVYHCYSLFVFFFFLLRQVERVYAWRVTRVYHYRCFAYTHYVQLTRNENV